MDGRKGLIAFAGGLVAGVALLGGARFAAMPEPPVVHYHANWAVMLNGARLDLSGDQYMEDVASCYAGTAQVMPQERVQLPTSSMYRSPERSSRAPLSITAQLA